MYFFTWIMKFKNIMIKIYMLVMYFKIYLFLSCS